MTKSRRNGSYTPIDEIVCKGFEVPIRGNHDNLSERRRYVIRSGERGTYVKDFSPTGKIKVLEGSENVQLVLNGGLEVFYKE